MLITYEKEHEKILQLKMGCEWASEVNIEKGLLLLCKFTQNKFEACFLFTKIGEFLNV